MPDLSRAGWTITASSQYDATRAPSYAIDGDDATYALTDVGFPHWFAVDMGSAQEINYVRYETPQTPGAEIPLGQNVPTFVKLYLSDDGIDWGTAVAEAVWPDDQRPHWIYFDTATKRHWKLEGVTDITWGLYYHLNYHRMACSEIYAGKLAAGDSYKVYYKCHPQEFEIQYANSADSYGIIDNLSLVLDPVDPSDIEIAHATANTRLWRTNPLISGYPECAAWSWDVPAGFPDSLSVETVTFVAEGTFTWATGFEPGWQVSWSPVQTSAWSGYHGEETLILDIGPWTTPRSNAVYDVSMSPPPDPAAFTAAFSFTHFFAWASLNMAALDHDANATHVDLTDFYYMVVYETVMPSPETEPVDLTANLTFSGLLLVTRTVGPGPGPTPCPDIVPGIIPPTPAPIPLECFHLVVAHPEDGIYVQFDFTSWLAPGDALSSATWTADAGVILTAQSATATTASLTASIPLAADGEEYFAKCTAITQMGTTEIRRVQLQVRTADFGTHQTSGWWRA